MKDLVRVVVEGADVVVLLLLQERGLLFRLLGLTTLLGGIK